MNVKKTFMKKNKILALFFLASLSMNGMAQTSHNVMGFVVDKYGKAVPGALVSVVNKPLTRVSTDENGKFVISAEAKNELQISAPDQSKQTVSVETDKLMTIVMGYSAQPVNIGFGIDQSVGESTASVASAFNEDFNKRSSKNIGNSLFGNVLGLTTLQGTGDYASYDPTFYVRGLQTLSSNSPLILVDGIERNISYVTPEEVESVTILKDAAAVALYGYKGINGAVNIVTKRGKYNTREIRFTYDHAINWEERRPDFVDSYTYANAMNEALLNDGKTAKYSQDELNCFQSGKYPYLYPNVNWIKETFKDTGASNIYNLSFRGGGNHMRYYTLLNVQMNDGFIAHSNMNEGYSTQNKYSKANLRTNLDIDLTSKTLLKVDLMGVLQESSRPGLSSDDLWGKIYTTPAAAFPIKTQDGIWGGSSTWDGYYNTVALTEGRAYTKGHTHALFSDMTLKQDLSSITPGLSATLQLAYDNISAYWENHSKSYKYGSDAATGWSNGVPTTTTRFSAGSDSSMGSDSKLDWENSNFNFMGGFDYNHTFGDHSLSSMLMWNYEYRSSNGQNNTYYRQNVASYTHYGYLHRYFLDLTLVGSSSNKLAPGHKWAFSPTVSAAWVLSNETFIKNLSFVDFLKLRASWGIINTDVIPSEDYWEQSFGGGSSYPMGQNYDGYSGWTEGRLASLNSTHEKANKYNIGLDATLFKGLNLTVDGYYQRRSNIWVSEGGRNSSVLGMSSPYVNAGVVDSWGFEVGANYIKKIGELTLNGGVNFTLSKNKIINELEEPKAYGYLKETGRSVGQIFGLQAIGFFKDQADIDHSPIQQFSEVKAGDIKYKDQNGDGIITENDAVAMGYNYNCPEIYYSFHLGLDWRGLGFDAMFQGTGHYTAVLNTQSVYWPLVNNTNISKYYYENRWTPNNPNAKYPRLCSQSNDNNFRTNSIWLADRSFLKLRSVELHYNFSQNLLNKMKVFQNAKLYVRGIDLLCFDHIKIADPEQYGATYPLNRSVNIGLVLGF